MVPARQLSAFPALERLYGARIHHGDAVSVLKTYPSKSIDVVISDVPYGLSTLSQAEVLAALGSWLKGEPHKPWSKGGVLGRSWDAFVPGPELWREVARVAKPGARVLVFGAPRTIDLSGLAMRIGGLEIFDLIGWIYGQGGAHGKDVAKAIDKARGVHRGKGVKVSENERLTGGNYDGGPKGRAVSEAARRWEGWSSQLRTALEPILAARVPLEATIEVNQQRYGTGAWNIDAGRVRTPAKYIRGEDERVRTPAKYIRGEDERVRLGRYPTNVVHDGSPEVLAQLKSKKPRVATMGGRHAGKGEHSVTPDRYFYCAKPAAAERLASGGHETLKPIALMRWLVRLATPPGGIVLDMCAGSGTTNAAALEEGFATIAIEQDAARIPGIRKRLEEIAARKKVPVE